MLKNIQAWLKRTGGIYVIVEGDEPQYVLLSIKDYEKLILSPQPEADINEEISAMNSEERLREPSIDEVINDLS